MADLLGQGPAIGGGQMHFGDDEIGPRAAREDEPIPAVAGAIHAQSGLRELRRDDLLRPGIVVDDEHSNGC